MPIQHLQAASVSGASASLVPQQYQQAATVSKEMSRFYNLGSEAKMSRMYEFMFTHIRRLESRLNEVAGTTSERFSQVDARLEALEQRAIEQTVRPNESTAEIVVSGLPTRGQLSYKEIVTRHVSVQGYNQIQSISSPGHQRVAVHRKNPQKRVWHVEKPPRYTQSCATGYDLRRNRDRKSVV